ncbi:MAG: hypothetical protein P8Y70_15590, partial [Candidatus Lokiarchaeota archaeon]
PFSPEPGKIRPCAGAVFKQPRLFNNQIHDPVSGDKGIFYIEFDLSKVIKNSELREKVSEIYEYIYKQNIKPSKREEINKIINLKQKIDIITRNVVGEILSKPQNLDKKEILLGLRKKFIQKPIEKDIKDFEIENSFKNALFKQGKFLF